MKTKNNKALHPQCWVCGHPVEKMEISENFFEEGKILTVFCHGERSEIRLSPEYYERWCVGGHGPLIAFDKTKQGGVE